MCLHVPNTSAYPEPDESSVHPLTLSVYDNFKGYCPLIYTQLETDFII